MLERPSTYLSSAEVYGFFGRFDASDVDACWIWQGAHSDGYGLIWAKSIRRPLLAHRVAYELLRGPIPVGLQLDHVCRVRDCVNPAHLEPVTSRENTQRGWRHRRKVTSRDPVAQADQRVSVSTKAFSAFTIENGKPLLIRDVPWFTPEEADRFLARVPVQSAEECVEAAASGFGRAVPTPVLPGILA